MITIKYAGRHYSARRFEPQEPVWPQMAVAAECESKPPEPVMVSVSVVLLQPVFRRRHVVKPDEESARRWLSDNGLRKSKAKKLLAAALRNEGDFADLNHPLRVFDVSDPDAPEGSTRVAAVLYPPRPCCGAPRNLVCKPDCPTQSMPKD